MSNWRPKHTAFTKWSNPYHLNCHTRADHTDECKAFEAGADAMLEALIKNCDVLEGVDDFGAKELWGAFNKKANNKCGYLVFIPDEEAKE